MDTEAVPNGRYFPCIPGEFTRFGKSGPETLCFKITLFPVSLDP